MAKNNAPFVFFGEPVAHCLNSDMLLPLNTLTLEIPEALAAELDAEVEAGWFADHAEAVRAAVRDLLCSPR